MAPKECLPLVQASTPLKSGGQVNIPDDQGLRWHATLDVGADMAFLKTTAVFMALSSGFATSGGTDDQLRIGMVFSSPAVLALPPPTSDGVAWLVLLVPSNHS